MEVDMELTKGIVMVITGSLGIIISLIWLVIAIKRHKYNALNSFGINASVKENNLKDSFSSHKIINEEIDERNIPAGSTESIVLNKTETSLIADNNLKTVKLTTEINEKTDLLNDEDRNGTLRLVIDEKDENATQLMIEEEMTVKLVE